VFDTSVNFQDQVAFLMEGQYYFLKNDDIHDDSGCYMRQPVSSMSLQTG